MISNFHLETDRLFLRPWSKKESDRKVFHQLNSDKDVMHYFPFRRSRIEADKVMEKMNANFALEGIGWCAVCLKETNLPIGFGGLAKVNFSKQLYNEVEIGWRILPEYWRKGYASEAATKLLEYGFNELKLQKIISFAVSDNVASTAVMKKIGMNHKPELDFDHPLVGDEHAHLRRHVYFEITKTMWFNLNSKTL